MGSYPEPLARLDQYFAAARIAHEVISDLHRELVSLGGEWKGSGHLVSESARITLADLRDVAKEARRLSAIWEEQHLLNAPEAVETLGAIATALNRIEPELARLRARQDEIAMELRDLVSRGSER